jgi:hypothetical protein
VVVDAGGAIVSTQGYYPYGETRYSTGSLYTDRLYTGQQQVAGQRARELFPRNDLILQKTPKKQPIILQNPLKQFRLSVWKRRSRRHHPARNGLKTPESCTNPAFSRISSLYSLLSPLLSLVEFAARSPGNQFSLIRGFSSLLADARA